MDALERIERKGTAGGEDRRGEAPLPSSLTEITEDTPRGSVGLWCAASLFLLFSLTDTKSRESRTRRVYAASIYIYYIRVYI